MALARTKAHGNTGAIKPHVVQRARSASLREPYISDHPPPSSKPAWHPKPDVWAALPGTTPVPLMEVTGCRWQIGETSPAMFCNAERHHGSWCEAHYKMSIPKPQGENK